MYLTRISAYTTKIAYILITRYCRFEKKIHIQHPRCTLHQLEVVASVSGEWANYMTAKLEKETLLPPALNNCRRFNELRTLYPIFCLNLRQVLRAGGSKSIPKITMLLTIKGRVSNYKSNLWHKKYIL
jgi:hypothetical protein